MTDSQNALKGKKSSIDETPTVGQDQSSDKKAAGKNIDHGNLADPLVRNRTYPDPDKVFSFAPVKLKAALQEGLVAIDTNALLLPYGTGRDSLKQIRLIYQQLTKENRLRIPGQVAREFADLRAEKLKTLYHQVALKLNLSLTESKYPLLGDIPEYSKVEKAEREIANAHGEYRKLVQALLERIADWRWDDPVSAIYREFFTPETVFDPAFDRDELLKDLEYRNVHRTPPGYKDSGKDDLGIGDLLIWKTLLAIGKKEQKHLIFVTGEEKSDWWYRSSNRALYPRFELVDEYRRASEGKSFQLIGFADLLKERSAPADVVEEIQTASEVNNEAALQYRTHLAESKRAAQAVMRWIRSLQPNANIHRKLGFPDIVTDSGHGQEGYEVKYFGGFIGANRRLRESLHEARAYARETATTVNLVLVTRGESEAAALYGLITSEGIRNPGVRLIIGTIEEGDRFKPWRVIDPGDLRPAFLDHRT